MKQELNMTTFGKRLRETRAEMGITQKELAELSGVSTVMISSYERSDAETGKNPSLNVVYSIASALGVSIDWLCGTTENKSLSEEINTKTFLLSYLQFFSKLSEKDINNLSASLKSSFDGIAIEIYKPIFGAKNKKNIYEFTRDIVEVLPVLKKDYLPVEIQTTIINKIMEKYEELPINEFLFDECFNVRAD